MRRKKWAALRILTPDILDTRIPKYEKDSVLNFKRLKKLEKQPLKEQRKQKVLLPLEVMKLKRHAFTQDWRRSIDLNSFAEEDWERLMDYIYSCNAFPDADWDEGMRVGADDEHLPRSFLLDAIHEAASEHCLFKHLVAGKSVARSDCPSPADRKLVDESNNDFVQRARVIIGRAQKAFQILDEQRIAGRLQKPEIKEIKELAEDENILDEVDKKAKAFESQIISTLTPTTHANPDFKTLSRLVAEEAASLQPVDAYQFEEDEEFGADALWTLDSSALLAFGWAAEAFIERMVYYSSEDDDSFEESEEEDDDEELPIQDDFDSDDSWFGPDIEDSDYERFNEKKPIDDSIMYIKE